MPITRISGPALRMLSTAPELAIHSIFASTVNLRAGQRLIACTHRSVSAPHGIEAAPADLRRLRESGEPLHWDARRHLITGPAGQPLIACIPRPEVFDPSIRPGCRRAPGPLGEHLAARPPRTGFGSDWSTLTGNRLLADAVAALAARRIDDAVLHWLGRGPGLTPSGDDILVGILATLRATGVLRGTQARLCASLESAAASRTTEISAEYLRYAGRGMVAGPLRDLLDALNGPRPAAVVTAVDRLTGYGQTSGADTILGVVAALAYLSRNEAADGTALAR